MYLITKGLTETLQHVPSYLKPLRSNLSYAEHKPESIHTTAGDWGTKQTLWISSSAISDGGNPFLRVSWGQREACVGHRSSQTRARVFQLQLDPIFSCCSVCISSEAKAKHYNENPACKAESVALGQENLSWFLLESLLTRLIPCILASSKFNVISTENLNMIWASLPPCPVRFGSPELHSYIP